MSSTLQVSRSTVNAAPASLIPGQLFGLLINPTKLYVGMSGGGVRLLLSADPADNPVAAGKTYVDTNFLKLTGGAVSGSVSIAGPLSVAGSITMTGPTAGLYFQDQINPTQTWEWQAGGGAAHLVTPSGPLALSVNNGTGDLGVAGNISTPGNVYANAGQFTLNVIATNGAVRTSGVNAGLWFDDRNTGSPWVWYSNNSAGVSVARLYSSSHGGSDWLTLTDTGTLACQTMTPNVLVVNNNASVAGTLFANGALQVAGSSTVHALTATSLTVNGTSTFNGTVGIPAGLYAYDIHSQSAFAMLGFADRVQPAHEWLWYATPTSGTTRARLFVDGADRLYVDPSGFGVYGFDTGTGGAHVYIPFIAYGPNTLGGNTEAGNLQVDGTLNVSSSTTLNWGLTVYPAAGQTQAAHFTGYIQVDNSVNSGGSNAGFFFSDRSVPGTVWGLYSEGNVFNINNTIGGIIAYSSNTGDFHALGSLNTGGPTNTGSLHSFGNATVDGILTVNGYTNFLQIATHYQPLVMANSLLPEANNTHSVGVPGQAFANMSAFAFITVTSLMSDIAPLNDDCLALVQQISPVMHSRSDDPDRRHWGFIAEEVGTAMQEIGYDFGGHVIDGDTHALNYGELLAVLWGAVRELAARRD